jgi:carbon-monoxide dehydrogenase small subunit
MDGVSVKSCALLGVQADGSTITTIEGVSEIGHMNALQAGFQAMHAVQCGFCTPGMIMSLSDLLARNPDASEAEVRAWLAGNLCRCTGYENVVRAVETAREIAQNPGKSIQTRRSSRCMSSTSRTCNLVKWTSCSTTTAKMRS